MFLLDASPASPKEVKTRLLAEDADADPDASDCPRFNRSPPHQPQPQPQARISGQAQFPLRSSVHLPNEKQSEVKRIPASSSAGVYLKPFGFVSGETVSWERNDPFCLTTTALVVTLNTYVVPASRGAGSPSIVRVERGLGDLLGVRRWLVGGHGRGRGCGFECEES